MFFFQNHSYIRLLMLCISQAIIIRAVTEISSCQGTEQPGSSFGLILLLFAMKIAGGHAYQQPQGNPRLPAFSDSPVYPSFPMSKLGLFADTIITRETIKPNNGDPLGALLFGCIVFVLLLYVNCVSVPIEGTPLF